MNQMELGPKAKAVLDRIRHTDKVLSIFEMPSDLAEAAVWEIGKLALEDKPVPLVQQNGYRWYLRELAKLLRTKTEWDLALEIEICLRKWVAYSLDPGLLQMLVCECYERIGAMTPEQVEEGGDSTTKTQSHEEGSGETRSQKSATRTQKCRGGRDLTTKTPRHEAGSDSDTGPLNPQSLEATPR